ncbi:sickle tail protein homolog [Morone saxatilis]|uniref:sickle tail protein homolog n=1 Tax=Morone saxatilis TaxID=34816 RepID=UPI0015E21953|nr:sickle tail protein homolog [Morone saxatilis]
MNPYPCWIYVASLQVRQCKMPHSSVDSISHSSQSNPGNSPSSTALNSSTEHLLQKKQNTNNSRLCNPDFSSCGLAPRSPSTLPRSYATATAAASRDSQLDSLMMQHTDVERKEVFLDHLRQKYPHHAAIIMGHQDRMKKQVGSPRPSESPTCAGVLGLVEQQDPLATEAMSDGEVLPPTAPFTRGCKARASLPVGRSSGQTRERPLGVLYLQYGEETKQARIPTEISSQDSLRALFVTAFPHQLTMKMLQSPSMAIYIKDNSRNVYYDLEDIRGLMEARYCCSPPGIPVTPASTMSTAREGGALHWEEAMLRRPPPSCRPKSRKYGDSQRPPLGTKTPPPSPHRVNEVKMIDGQIIGGVGLVSPERMSPIRRSLQRDSNGATVDIINRSGSSSSTSSVFVDSPLGQPERLFQGPVTASNTQSERMKAMEEQIASLAGLVHHALSMGSDVPGVKDTVSEPAGRKLFNNRPGVSTEVQNPAALTDHFSPTPLALQAPPSDSGMQQSLMLAKKSVCELRLQLNQLRHLQLSNQESVSSMLRMAGQELVVLMCDRLAQSEEVAYRRRTEMEEERIHYLATEERILSQLNELENYVDRLQRSSASSPGRLSITLRDVEEGAVNLRRVGEAVAILKAPAAPSQLPAATVEPPPSAAPLPPPPAVPSPSPSASPSTERSSRPQVEKPRRSSVDKEMKQSPDRSGKSPPPPPPRRFHAVSSGLTTGRSGEVILTSRKEPVGAQNEDEKEKVVVPQPKPPRQPPEVKPKPQMFLASSSLTPATDRAHRDEEEEEEEDSKFMKELQVTTQLSNKTNLPGGNKLWKRELKTSPKSQVANQNPSELATSAYQSAPQPQITDGCPRKLIIAAGLEEHSEAGKGSVSLDKIENVVKHVRSLNSATIEKVQVHPPEALQDIQKNEEVPTPTQKKAKKTEVLTVTTSQKENDITVNTHEQINKEVVGHVCSPTSAEKKVKFTTIVTLQKENMPASPVQTNESIKEVPAEKKSDVIVVLTLQKENTPEDCLIELSPKFQQDKYLCSDQECVASFQLQQLPPISPILTYSHGSKQQNQESTVQVSRDQSQYAEEGGSLNPEIWDDEGPPPSPPKISLRISKTRVRTHSQEEDLTKIIGSDIQSVTGDSTGEPTYREYENQGFEDSNDSDMKPILVILNELDIQSAYKRLSTIFECEEDLDGLLSPENIVDEEQTKQEQKQDVKNICIDSDITGNGQSSTHLQHQKPSEDNGSIPKKKEDQDKPDSPRKAETKRKFKFKFPKNKLAAISQAIRTGTTKTGKNTLEVVVYEEEEEKAPDSRPLKETKKQTKKFEINSTKQMNSGESNACDRDIKVSSPIDTRHSKSHSRVEELCKSAFDSIDYLEESIKQLEISVDSITAPSSPSSIVSSPPQSPDSSFDSTDRAQHKVKVKQERERSLSKRPAPQILKGPNPPQSKRAKPQPPHDKGKTSTKKQTSSSSSSSSVQRSHIKSHHSPSSCSPEKTPKGHQQAIQKQPSQADSRSSRAAGDSNHSVVALRASKIPALCHSSGKHPSASLSTPHCSDTTDSLQNFSSSPSSSSASSPSVSSSSSFGKHSLLSASIVSKAFSHSSSPSSAQRFRQQAFLSSLSSSSSVKNSSSVSPSNSPLRSPSPSSNSFSSSPPPHKSFIPSLNLSHLLPSSSHILSPSHASSSPAYCGPCSSKRQHCLALASTSSTASTSQHSYYSSSSYSSSSPSSSSTSSSLSPTSSSSSPPSPSTSLLPTMASHRARSVRTSGSNPSTPNHGKKRTGGQAGRVPRTVAATLKDAA